mgnify:CR=1 FL=1
MLQKFLKGNNKITRRWSLLRDLYPSSIRVSIAIHDYNKINNLDFTAFSVVG